MGVIIFLIILSIILIYNKLEAILKILGDYESLRLASFSAGLIFFALIFDLEFVSLRWSFLKFLEEVFELNAALMLLFASYSIKSSPT